MTAFRPAIVATLSALSLLGTASVAHAVSGPGLKAEAAQAVYNSPAAAGGVAGDSESGGKGGPSDTAAPADPSNPADTDPAGGDGAGGGGVAGDTENGGPASSDDPATSTSPSTSTGSGSDPAATETVTASTASLPFTGANIGVVAGFGLLLLGGGIVLRRRVTEH